MIYDGEWINGKKNGKGKETLPDGNIYEGDFVGGLKHGLGINKIAGGEEIYQEEWEEGNLYGKMKYSLDG